MRRLLAIALLLAPAAVWAGGVTAGPTGRAGFTHGGPNLNYSHQSGGSYVRGGFQTGGQFIQAPPGSVLPRRGGWSGAYRPPGYGLPGSGWGGYRSWGYGRAGSGWGGYRSWGYGLPGGYGGGYYPFGYGYCYTGWLPYSPFLYSGFYNYAGGVGPFEFVDATVFTGSPAVPVFPAQPPVAPGPPAPDPRVPAAGVPPENQGILARRLVDMGDDFFGRGDFGRAVDAYRLAAQRTPDDPMAAFALGHGLFATGAYGAAAAELRRALGLYPAMVQVNMNRRAFYGDPARFDEQVGRLALHVAANPGDAAARFLLGYNYFFSGRRAEAQAQFAALGARDATAQLFLQELARGQ